MPQAPLTSSLRIGSVEVPNRVLLAPLAGIGNWFVRLQARRFGAGMAFSEMISSFGLAHRNRRTVKEMLRIDPEEGVVALQLFGSDPDVMRAAAATAAEAGPDLIDLNMGCPVPKVVKTGAGSALLGDPDRAIAVATAAIEGSGLPVTVKLRSGYAPGDRSGLELARRLEAEAGVAAVTLHPRPAATQHRGAADYEQVRELAARLQIPVIVSGGARTAAAARVAYERSGAAAVMIARGSLGNPWIFSELTGGRSIDPGRAEIEAELEWVIDRAAEHWGPQRAARNLRKFYPWYLHRLGFEGVAADRFQRSETLEEVRDLLGRSAVAASL